MDAQDYLGNWHLSIVIDADGDNKVIHFLPFAKANRNEQFSAQDDLQRIAAAFTMQEASEDPLADIKTLREYLQQNKPKIAKDQPTNLSRSAAANHSRVKSEPKEAGVQGSSQLK